MGRTVETNYDYALILIEFLDQLGVTRDPCGHGYCSKAADFSEKDIFSLIELHGGNSENIQ